MMALTSWPHPVVAGDMLQINASVQVTDALYLHIIMLTWHKMLL